MALPRLAISRALGTVVVTAHGDLSGHGADELPRAVLEDLVDGQGNLSVAVDLHDVAGIDEAGVRILAWAARRVTSRGGAFRLARPPEAVIRSLRGTRRGLD